jgi:tetratricopeptide (TPR) repeat protein
MSTYKKKQKELRSPDAFQRAGREAIPWLVHNQVRLLALVVLVVVGGAVAGLWTYGKQRAELREAEAFSDALALLGVATKSPSEIDAALLASLQAFEAQSEGETPAARNAHLLLAYVHLRMGNPEEALKAAQQFLAKTPPGNPLYLSALEAKGYALEQSKQYELAFEAFGELETSSTHEDLKGKGQYHQARMLLLKGQREEALALFEKVAALDLPRSEAVMLAQLRVEELSQAQPANPTATEPSANNEADNKAN